MSCGGDISRICGKKMAFYGESMILFISLHYLCDCKTISHDTTQSDISYPLVSAIDGGGLWYEAVSHRVAAYTHGLAAGCYCIVCCAGGVNPRRYYLMDDVK